MATSLDTLPWAGWFGSHAERSFAGWVPPSDDPVGSERIRRAVAHTVQHRAGSTGAVQRGRITNR